MFEKLKIFRKKKKETYVGAYVQTEKQSISKMRLRVSRCENSDHYEFSTYLFGDEFGDIKIIHRVFVSSKEFCDKGKSLGYLNSLCGSYEIDRDK